ncbi:ribulose-phosphate 3 epimerase domain protein [Leptospira interrogans serovar Icterohaemorrhagiae str. Verdun HP]|uniref:Ribulose-phosphate 3 epimerase domain protein n=1 Tax=Leptospira interrogans serovar Icterohaemorrhagiae str. Verdun HP TaxID=1049910 RepID=M6R514_LEPIR|nr:ribulose-phosphate 3 epimerase domain protein [Leptospira interrogans serovar Icterohaemorrhagiae str. Verdun HP]
MKISASILATKLTELVKTVPNYDPTAIDLIHMDVMDGNFVPQISFGEALTKEVKSLTSIPLDVHLMVAKPENHVLNIMNSILIVLRFISKRLTFRFVLRKKSKAMEQK